MATVTKNTKFFNGPKQL